MAPTLTKYSRVRVVDEEVQVDGSSEINDSMAVQVTSSGTKTFLIVTRSTANALCRALQTFLENTTNAEEAHTN